MISFHFCCDILLKSADVTWYGNFIYDFITARSKVVILLCIICVISVLCLLCFRGRLFIDALLSPAGKGLTSWPLFVMSNCEFVTFPCGILRQVWYLIVLNPDLRPLSYYET